MSIYARKYKPSKWEPIIFADKLDDMFKGWMGNYYKIMSRQQRKHMIELFERLFNKQVRIHKHKMIITETA